MARIKRLKAFSPDATITSLNARTGREAEASNTLKNVGKIVRTRERRRGDSRASLHTHCFLHMERKECGTFLFHILEISGFSEHVKLTADVS